jgi:ubiquinone/menaquinone biosynthesis C-methylase UbiE
MPHEYSPEPVHAQRFTEKYNSFYSRFAPAYDSLIELFPLWRNWLDNTLPWIQGTRVLEVSCGTGYLLTRYASQYDVYAFDLNFDLACIAKNNLQQRALAAHLQVANVEYIPYRDGVFDTVLNTMAFTAYPDGVRALAEISRVLKPGGRLVILDINYPQDKSTIGTLLTKAWKAGGDIVRDMGKLFDDFGYDFSDQEVGGYGSVHLYIATKGDKR